MRESAVSRFILIVMKETAQSFAWSVSTLHYKRASLSYTCLCLKSRSLLVMHLVQKISHTMQSTLRKYCKHKITVCLAKVRHAFIIPAIPVLALVHSSSVLWCDKNCVCTLMAQVLIPSEKNKKETTYGLGLKWALPIHKRPLPRTSMLQKCMKKCGFRFSTNLFNF